MIQLSQVNFSTPGSLTPVDHWHNDSIAYAGVVVISDMEGMVGGDLELFRVLFTLGLGRLSSLNQRKN